MRLNGKVAVITGAGSGIGRSMAILFAREGARVVATDIVPERIHEVVATVRESGGTIDGVVGDVSKEADADRVIGKTMETHGVIDVLCNNAGIMDRLLPAAELPLELWRKVLDVNLTGPYLLCRGVIPIMLEHGGGVILNNASVGGLQGGRAGAAYTASKHGLVGLTKNIAWYYGDQGIRAVALCPGAVETQIGIGGNPSPLGLAKMQRAQGTMPRPGTPEELAQVALFLVSDEASYVNGATLVVDGGWTAY